MIKRSVVDTGIKVYSFDGIMWFFEFHSDSMEEAISELYDRKNDRDLLYYQKG